MRGVQGRPREAFGGMMTEMNRQKQPYPLGAHAQEQGVRFSFVSRSRDCGICLYDRETGKLLDKIPFSPGDRVGNVWCRFVDKIDPGKVTYQFYEGDRILPDSRGKVFPGKAVYGKERPLEKLKAGFLTREFDWGEDACPRIPYSKALVYCLHVRGFTRHSSSHVAHPGTFAGLMEKIAHLKEAGVTTLEVQPAYEFLEVPAPEKAGQFPDAPSVCGRAPHQPKLNYWGYQRGFYYAPKAAYAASEDAPGELKALIRALHENGMEFVMQFYFPREVKRSELAEILRFWVLEYHVDGFHLMGEDLPVDLLAADDALADTKLWYDRFDTAALSQEEADWPHAAEYNDGWYYDMRRFLKGDEGMLESVLYRMRHIPQNAGSIHYLTNYYGFTLADLVSYDYKHNEANGEENRDGNDYNASWNCGEEGPTRREKVKKLRLKQMKNAMCLLMLSQSTPLIFMGDEFGNSQKGNNNPYCQDNGVAWLDWNLLEKNREIWEFWRQLAAFRRAHPILSPSGELKLMDSLSCGYPDLSYHGQNAWRPQTEPYYRHIGILLCERYVRPQDGTLLYLALNLHWETHELALPRPPKGMVWELAFSTEGREETQKQEDGAEGNEMTCRIPARSIAVYVSRPGQENGREIGKGKNAGRGMADGKDMEAF